MKIATYILTHSDEIDTLPWAIDSVRKFSDHIYLLDGGSGDGVPDGNQRFTVPLVDWLAWDAKVVSVDGRAGEFTWSDVPLTLWYKELPNPAMRRNYVLQRLKGTDADFVCWIDSDEMCSDQFIAGVRPLLSSLPADIVGVTPKWLNLVQDFEHCVGGHHSDWLAHPRIHRPDAAWWSGSYHENMVINHKKLFKWDARIIHTVALRRKRLLVKKSHPTIRYRSLVNPIMSPLWDDAIMENVPQGISFVKPQIAADEFLPLDADALTIWDEKGNPV